MLLREETLARHQDSAWDKLATIMAGLMGVGIGVVAGFVASEMVGEVNSGRVKRAVRRIKNLDETATDPMDLEREIIAALEENSATQGMDIVVRTLGDSVAELTGTAPSRSARDLAGKVARSAPGASTVVNRILVRGLDIPVDTRIPAQSNS